MSSGNSMVFNGRKKQESAYKRIEGAMADGLEFIEFDSSEINPQTIRVYVSQLNIFSNKQMRVSVKDSKITVYFKKPNQKKLFEVDLRSLINKYPDISGTDLNDIISDVIGLGFKEETSTEIDPMDAIFEYIAKNPIQAIDSALEGLVFEDKISTSVYSDIIRMVKNTENKAAEGALTLAAAEEGVTGGIMPQAPPIHSQAAKTGTSEAAAANSFTGGEDEPKIEIVDGLRQHVIPGLDKDTLDKVTGYVEEKKLPEDDEF